MIFKMLLIFFAGLVAGFMNVNAGGGSLITLPALIFLGLPSAVANGTNRIAILVGAISATKSFRQKGIFDWRFGLELGIPALIGAMIGACIAVSIPDRMFNAILSGVMALVVFAVLFKPQKKIKIEKDDMSPGRRIFAGSLFFFIGIYAGFIQAGVGFLIIAALSLMTGLSLVRINSLKVFVVLVYTIFSIAIFVINGKIDITAGLTLSLGNAIGAHFGTHFAVTRGDKWIRIILVVTVIAMAVKLSGIIK